MVLIDLVVLNNISLFLPSLIGMKTGELNWTKPKICSEKLKPGTRSDQLP